MHDLRSVSRLLIGFLFVAVLAGGATAWSQQTTPAAPTPSATQPLPARAVPTFHVAVREVLLDVVVTDRGGHPIPGLTAVKGEEFAGYY